MKQLRKLAFVAAIALLAQVSQGQSAVYGTGPTNTIAVWTDGTTIGNSFLSQSGSNVSVKGNLTLTSSINNALTSGEKRHRRCRRRRSREIDNYARGTDGSEEDVLTTQGSGDILQDGRRSQGHLRALRELCRLHALYPRRVICKPTTRSTVPNSLS